MQNYEKENINPEHLEAIVMSACGHSIQMIADKYDVSYRTIQNWRSRPDFQRLVKQCTVEIFDKAISNISLGAEAASNELQRIIEDADTPIRLKLQAISLIFSIGGNFKKNLIEDEPIAVALNFLVVNKLLDMKRVKGILAAVQESERVLNENLEEVFNAK